jgi:hypothetical protein
MVAASGIGSHDRAIFRGAEIHPGMTGPPIQLGKVCLPARCIHGKAELLYGIVVSLKYLHGAQERVVLEKEWS